MLGIFVGINTIVLEHFAWTRILGYFPLRHGIYPGLATLRMLASLLEQTLSSKAYIGLVLRIAGVIIAS